MTKEEKIRFLAELDGWERKPWSHNYWCSHDGKTKVPNNSDLPLYLTSYDAIIPLIQKQSRGILTRIVLSTKGQNDISRMVDWLMFSPEQLADILIKVIENESKN